MREGDVPSFVWSMRDRGFPPGYLQSKADPDTDINFTSAERVARDLEWSDLPSGIAMILGEDAEAGMQPPPPSPNTTPPAKNTASSDLCFELRVSFGE